MQLLWRLLPSPSDREFSCRTEQALLSWPLPTNQVHEPGYPRQLEPLRLLLSNFEPAPRACEPAHLQSKRPSRHEPRIALRRATALGPRSWAVRVADLLLQAPLRRKRECHISLPIAGLPALEGHRSFPGFANNSLNSRPNPRAGGLGCGTATPACQSFFEPHQSRPAPLLDRLSICRP